MICRQPSDFLMVTHNSRAPTPVPSWRTVSKPRTRPSVPAMTRPCRSVDIEHPARAIAPAANWPSHNSSNIGPPNFNETAAVRQGVRKTSKQEDPRLRHRIPNYSTRGSRLVRHQLIPKPVCPTVVVVDAPCFYVLAIPKSQGATPSLPQRLRPYTGCHPSAVTILSKPAPNLRKGLLNLTSTCMTCPLQWAPVE